MNGQLLLFARLPAFSSSDDLVSSWNPSPRCVRPTGKASSL